MIRDEPHDCGELWESGTPKQIFENPQRKETRDFVFRVRNWNWEVRSADYDYAAMFSSLTEFCVRQFLGRRITLACQLAIEEITSAVLLPLAQRRGIDDPRIAYELSVGEGGEEADLLVDLRELGAAGISDDELAAAIDDVSKQILESMVARQYAGQLWRVPPRDSLERKGRQEGFLTSIHGFWEHGCFMVRAQAVEINPNEEDL